MVETRNKARDHITPSVTATQKTVLKNVRDVHGNCVAKTIKLYKHTNDSVLCILDVMKITVFFGISFVMIRCDNWFVNGGMFGANFVFTPSNLLFAIPVRGRMQ